MKHMWSNCRGKWPCYRVDTLKTNPLHPALEGKHSLPLYIGFRRTDAGNLVQGLGQVFPLT